MIKAHCNICDKVIKNPNSEGRISIVSPWKDTTIVLHIVPLFVKKEDSKDLKLTILQESKSLIDTLETGHICEICLLNALSNPKNQFK